MQGQASTEHIDSDDLQVQMCRPIMPCRFDARTPLLSSPDRRWSQSGGGVRISLARRRSAACEQGERVDVGV